MEKRNTGNSCNKVITMGCNSPKRWSVSVAIILVMSVVTACVGFYILTSGSSAEPTLRFVSIIHRHGDRAPEVSYPLDPYKGESFWPEGLGALLQRGKIGLYRLGTFLRQCYDGFLSAKYSPAEIFILSSSTDRCLMSASLVLAGLYPPVGLQSWNPHLKWQPIPIHTVPLPNDDEDEGLSLPEWAHSIDRERLRLLANIFTLRPFATPSMTKLKSGVLINEILMNMKKKANASEMFERRINVYSAHDTTIANLWRGFNVIEKLEFPSYGAALMIELHEIDDKYQVKILYKKSHLDDDLIELKIEGCKDNQGKETDAMCDLHIFLSALQPVVIENFDEACEVPNEQI